MESKIKWDSAHLLKTCKSPLQHFFFLHCYNWENLQHSKTTFVKEFLLQWPFISIVGKVQHIMEVSMGLNAYTVACPKIHFLCNHMVLQLRNACFVPCYVYLEFVKYLESKVYAVLCNNCAIFGWAITILKYKRGGYQVCNDCEIKLVYWTLDSHEWEEVAAHVDNQDDVMLRYWHVAPLTPGKMQLTSSTMQCLPSSSIPLDTGSFLLSVLTFVLGRSLYCFRSPSHHHSRDPTRRWSLPSHPPLRQTMGFCWKWARQGRGVPEATSRSCGTAWRRSGWGGWQHWAWGGGPAAGTAPRSCGSVPRSSGSGPPAALCSAC